MEMKQLPIGKSDFKQIIEDNYCYVDKTLFIKEVIDKGDSILLIPRPRRFGKTLNLSMLKYFYDCCPQTLSSRTQTLPTGTGTPGNSYGKLFDSLAISRAGKKYLDHMGKYPVIFLSFRDIKEMEWETCMDKIEQLIQDEYSKHYYLLKSKELIPPEKDYFKRIIERKASKGDYEKSLEKLLIFLNRFYGERVVILIDEYDAPVHEGFNRDFYEEIINFMRNFLCAGLKDTDQYLEKSIITGIMRIAKESIFSGLNNPGVYTLLSEEFEGKFGFTEKEVEHLIRGETIEKAIEEDIVLKDTPGDEDLMWSFLLMGGYLKQSFMRRDEVMEKTYYTLTIPNKEVRSTYTRVIRRYFSDKIENSQLEIMLKALIEGDIDVFEEIFSDYVVTSMSFFDMGAGPEKVYHAFVMGLFLWLSPAYQVKSNRESGYGRYDL